MIYSSSKVFGGPQVVMEGTLKNPNQYRNAVLFESLSMLPEDKRKEFINSQEAKFMMENDMISPETLDRLMSDDDNRMLKTTICHMAKENGDPLWDDLVQARIQERRVMNDLIAKYGEEAKPVMETNVKKFIETCIPEYFRHN